MAASTTATEAPTSSAPTSDFPQLERVAWGFSDYYRDYALTLFHDGGGCIEPSAYRWEIGDESGRVVTAERDGPRHSGDPLATWCIHDYGAVLTDSSRPNFLKVYRLSDGALLFTYTFPPWPENASATVSSPSSGIIEITLVRSGANAPYDNSDSVERNDSALTINGQTCDLGDAADTDGSPSYEVGITGPAALSAGSVLRINEAGTGTGCVDAFSVGEDNVSVVFSVAGATILSTTVDVRAA